MKHAPAERFTKNRLLRAGCWSKRAIFASQTNFTGTFGSLRCSGDSAERRILSGNL
jgi:hypothetical protein